MSHISSRKRKRPITSCGECYRRKQKCDRELPCAICVIRGVTEKCSYGYVESDHDSNIPSPKRINASDDTILSKASIDDLPTPPDLGQQTGYSLAIGSNFGILQKTLHHSEDASFSLAQEMPAFVLYQIKDIEKQLPTKPIQIQLIDLYFSECWWWFSGANPVAFRQKFDQWHRTNIQAGQQSQSKPLKYFSALLFQTLAVSLQHTSSKDTQIRAALKVKDTKCADLLSIKYSKAGMQIMDLLGRNNSHIHAVQHDMIRGIWLKNFSRGTESWYSLGNAIRQAQELGLHQKGLQSSDTNISNEQLWQDLLERRIWSSLFSWDAHVSFTLGRPRIINSRDCTKMDLVACDVPYDMSTTPPPNVSEFSKPCMATPIVFHYSMGFLIHEMLDAGADKPDFTEYTIIDTLHDEMGGLLRDISPFFRSENPDTSWDLKNPNILIMRLHLTSIANTYLVALHRAHALRRRENCEAAVNAALTTLKAQEQLFSITDKHKWRIYTYSFYTIDASIFLAALLLENPDTLALQRYPEISQALRNSLNRLREMRDASPMAKSGAHMLGQCLDRMEKREVGKWFESPAYGSSEALQVTPVQESPNVSSDNNTDFATSPSLRAWIEQMDQVMLPILEAGPNGPFDDTLWEMLLEG